MNSLLSKLKINYKSILFLLLISLIPIIGLTISIIWIDNNELNASLDAQVKTLIYGQIIKVCKQNQSLMQSMSSIGNYLTHKHLARLPSQTKNDRDVFQTTFFLVQLI